MATEKTESEYVRPEREPGTTFTLFASGQDLNLSDVALKLASAGVNATLSKTVGVWKGELEAGVSIMLAECDRSTVRRAADLLGGLGCKEVLLHEAQVRYSHLEVGA